MKTVLHQPLRQDFVVPFMAHMNQPCAAGLDLFQRSTSLLITHVSVVRFRLYAVDDQPFKVRLTQMFGNGGWNTVAVGEVGELAVHETRRLNVAVGQGEHCKNFISNEGLALLEFLKMEAGNPTPDHRPCWRSKNIVELPSK